MTGAVSNFSFRSCSSCCKKEEAQKAQLEEKRHKAGAEYAAALAALHSGSAKAAQSAFDNLKKSVEPSDPLRPAVEQLGIAVQERQDCLAHRRQLAAYARVQAGLHKLNSTVDRQA